MRLRYSEAALLAMLVMSLASAPALADGPVPIRPEYIDKLEKYLWSESVKDYEGPDSGIGDPEKWTLEAGVAAIPVLKRGLSDQTTEERQYLAAYFLGLIGGHEARDILKHEYELAHDTWLKALLCFCMSSTGDEQDINFLIQSLKGETIGDDWPPIEAAALALGVLRPQKAVVGLTACAKKDRGSIASDAADKALKWIQGRSPQTPQAKEAPEREQIILAMFRCGIPRTEESDDFYEGDRNLRWLYRDGAWKFQPVISDAALKDVPGISFDVYVTQDHSKALVAVGMTFGPLNGKGYNYVLEKDKGEWRVVGILSTWIS